MKELTIDNIKEAVKNFSASWMNINEGDSAKFVIVSRTIYNIPAGEEGLDGSVTEFDKWQCKVEDKDGVERVLKVQQRLAKGMLNLIEGKGLSWEESFKGSSWYVERIDQYNWKVELLDWVGRNDNDDDSAGEALRKKVSKVKPEKKKLVSRTVSKAGDGEEEKEVLKEELMGKKKKAVEKDIPQKEEKEDKPGGLSLKGTVAYDLIVNNELYQKEFTRDALQTVISSLGDLNLDDAAEAIEELIADECLKIENEKVVWLIE